MGIKIRKGDTVQVIAGDDKGKVGRVLSVDEDSPQIHVVTEDSELDIGESRVLVVSLPPGHYVFYCNLEGHYLGGMHASLVVS